MQTLANENKNAELIKLFSKYLNMYKTDKENGEQAVPEHHLDLASIALLKLVLYF